MRIERNEVRREGPGNDNTCDKHGQGDYGEEDDEVYGLYKRETNRMRMIRLTIMKN